MKSGKIKQDVMMKDSTACTRLTVWESDVNKLQPGQCYRLLL